MAGTSIDNFGTFVRSTGPAIFTGPQDIINDAVQTNYTFGHFLKGKNAAEVVQGGTKIQDTIFLNSEDVSQMYDPNVDVTWSQVQPGTNYERPWRFSLSYISWTDHEIELQAGSQFSNAFRKTKYKDIKFQKEQNMWTGLFGFMDTQLWADPYTNYTAMESSAGTAITSIPAYITEDTTNYHPYGWTNIMGIDPASESNWRNQVNTYDYDDPDDSNGDRDGLLDAFDLMQTKLSFAAPPKARRYFEGGSKQAPATSNIKIFCSASGLQLYQSLLRDSNDTLLKKTDSGYKNVTNYGHEVVYIANLDTAAIYNSQYADQAGVTEANDTYDGYRYWWINTDYLKVIFHSSRYFWRLDDFRLHNQPFTHVAVTDLWWNTFCCSRRRQGIVAPKA